METFWCGWRDILLQSVNYIIKTEHHTKLFRKFLDAGIQDESTSISIELGKMTKIIKFEEMSEPDDESDKHI